MHDFTVTVEQHPDLTLIKVAGEIDLDTAPAVDEAALVVPLGGKTLSLDLSRVPFMDSSGLNLLLRLRRRMLTEAGHLVVTGLQEQAANLLRLTGTYDLLTAADEGGPTLPNQRKSPLQRRTNPTPSW